MSLAIQKLNMLGHGHVELWRDNKCIYSADYTNAITNIGKNVMLDAMFSAGTQYSAWYIGLIGNTGYSSVSINDTMLVHSGWQEYTNTDGSSRLSWTHAAASGQQVFNSPAITVVLNAANTLQGVFITSNAPKSGTDGILWSTALFSTPLVSLVGDILKITYAVQL